ncbi:hypothetical protein GCM10010512_39210 [Streptomyces thermoviolaceus subsp. thermoviolaceus]|uniref:Uncharacterized protein n=1 Tax=Streptomyces thermoviolaceus subsp. thermoviolaceus TaxID=66860 RepID=A0ABX0YZR5_STRTL|nr:MULTISPECIES: hypothetical protein [Streptomyces]NJP16538.1 hypothetical protein [Streptomyces thermoviolaceus subsp. thermoviolaceus]RSS05546.1 hypothetical protein EF917_08915 [Streptomyces sp. WAC00469]WTD46518.1 hypothetical protein OG899_02695 [Streptomyces thermoviolaceus]GHB03869.1 hypothetical protein GCM10010512_39210 [Streptomyces thermoviolaceus subsp. thermoviolaceus]
MELAAFARVRRPVTVPDPRMSADLVVHADGHRIVRLVGQNPGPVTVRPVAEGTPHPSAAGHR